MTMTENLEHNNEDDRRTPAATGAFLGPLSVLARQKATWSPALLAGILWRAITNIGTHREVVRLLKLPPFSDAIRKNPRFAFKYLAPHYLCRSLTLTERAACFLHHHRRIYAAFPDRLLRQTLESDVAIHEIVEGDNRFIFSVGLSRPCDKEGELSLNLQVDDEIVFVLSFTVVPGWVVKSSAPEVILVTRLQGTPGCYPKIRLATAALRDVALSGLLFAALQGFASAFEIRGIVAANAVNQTSYAEEFAASFNRAYDEFYADLGMDLSEAGFYRGTIPIEGKPLEMVKKNHRSRTKEQRRFKQEIQGIFATFFGEHILHSQPFPELSAAVKAGTARRTSSHSLPCPALEKNPSI